MQVVIEKCGDEVMGEYLYTDHRGYLVSYNGFSDNTEHWPPDDYEVIDFDSDTMYMRMSLGIHGG